jgi:putative endonuclease
VKSKQVIGAAGELRARRFLEAKGYEFVTANVRTRYGEIDLIMRDGQTLVFVEVKARRSGVQGFPEEAVTKGKLSHTTRAAEALRKEQGHDGPWRIDVVAIDRRIRHLTNVSL